MYTLSYSDLYLSNLTPDFTAGALLAFFTVLDNYTLTLKMGTETVTLTKETTLPFFIKSPLFNSYILYTNISPQEFETVSILFDDMGWWLKNSNATYNLVVFETKDFINGFISICNYLNTDFRDYIAGTPFYITAGNKMNLYIEGYDIKTGGFNVNNYPSQVIPYYTGSFEDDRIDWI
jgi:hypothetical protein